MTMLETLNGKQGSALLAVIVIMLLLFAVSVSWRGLKDVGCYVGKKSERNAYWKQHCEEVGK